jgi:hypothetical protein
MGTLTREVGMGIRETIEWMCDWDVRPDFKQIVEKSLALFGVFTGVAFSFYVKDFLFGTNLKDGFKDFPALGRILIAVSVISLLLRYIIGSAVHLNATYVAKVTTTIQEIEGRQVLVEDGELRSDSLGWLFFDIIMLVGFGILAVLITDSNGFEDFLLHSLYFILAGLVWSGFALLWRPGDFAVAERWWLIDMWQLILTLALIVMPWNVLGKAAALAIVYAICLFFDFCVVSRPHPTPHA